METIKLLRERTGAGMVDCKKSLDEAGGDLDKAVDLLRARGIAKAAKREGHEAKEGIIKMVATPDNGLALIEFNAETDFVVRSEQFQKFTDSVVAVVAEQKPADLTTLLSAVLADGTTLKDSLDHLSGVIGEKLVIGRYELIIGAATVAGYVHASGKMAALVELNETGAEELARDLAMQVVAANPKYVVPAEVEPAELDREKAVYAEQLKGEGKPEAMLEKIIEGKLNKYYEAVCLIKQEYIKDDKQKVEQILAGKTVKRFIRFSL